MKRFSILFLILFIPSICFPGPLQQAHKKAIAGQTVASGGVCTSTEYSLLSSDATKTLVFRSTVGAVFGYRFTVGGTGRTVCKATAYFQDRVGGTPSPDTIHAEIWTDSANLPGTQVGSDSDDTQSFTGIATDATPTERVFTWASGPSTTPSTSYWLLIYADWTIDAAIYCKGNYNTAGAEYICYGAEGSLATTDAVTGVGEVYYAE